MTAETRDDIEQQVAHILEGAAPPYRSHARERALCAMASARSGRAAQVGRGGAHARRRSVYAVGAIAVLAALAIGLMPWRGPDAFAVLAAAAQAASQSTSIRIVRGPTDRVPPGTPLTYFMSGWGGPHAEERVLAAGPHSIRRLDVDDGSLSSYLVEDADTGEYCLYSPQEKAIYTADLRPLGSALAIAVAANAKGMWESEQFGTQLSMLQRVVAGKAMRKSVADGVYHTVQPMQFSRGGEDPDSRRFELDRSCQVVTIAWTVATTPKLLTSRVEFYLDSETRRPFAERQYFKIEGQPERLIGNIVKIEYDVPFPPRDGVRFAPGTRTVPGTVRAVDIRNRFGHAVGFELLSGGRQVTAWTWHVPD
jgi:hypothetical protein